MNCPSFYFDYKILFELHATCVRLKLSVYYLSFDFIKQEYFFDHILEIQNICVLHNSSSFNGVMIGNIWEFNLPCNFTLDWRVFFKSGILRKYKRKSWLEVLILPIYLFESAVHAKVNKRYLQNKIEFWL